MSFRWKCLARPTSFRCRGIALAGNARLPRHTARPQSVPHYPRVPGIAADRRARVYPPPSLLFSHLFPDNSRYVTSRNYIAGVIVGGSSDALLDVPREIGNLALGSDVYEIPDIPRLRRA